MSGGGGRAAAWLRRYGLEPLLGLITLAFFSDYLFGSDILYGTDSVPGGIFFRGLLVDFVREFGELPRWNPYILGGLPFIDATHGDTFFPTSVLQFLAPVHRGMGHKLVVHVFLAGVFMAFYLRTLRLRPGAVAFGAIAYMLSPVFVSYIFAGQDGKMYVTSLAPLGFALLERAMRSGRLGDFLLLGVGLGFTILSAQIQMAYHLMWFVGGLFILRLFCGLPSDGGDGEDGRGGRGRHADGNAGGETNSRSPARVRRVVFFAAAVLVSLLIASIQLMPAVAYVKHPAGFSVRSDKTDYEHASSWSLHPEEIASMVVPEFCNAPRGYWGRNVFKYNSDYVGILVLALAALSLRRRRDATRLFLAGSALFAVAYSLGGHTPIHRICYAIVPQVKLFRAPPLIMFAAAMSLAALAAHAVDDLLAARERGSPRKRVPRSVFGLGGAAVLLALVAAGAAGFTENWTGFFLPEHPAAKLREQAANLGAFRQGAWIVALQLALAAVVIGARALGRLRSGPTAILLTVLVVVDLWRVDTRFKLVVDPTPYIQPTGALARVAEESAREKFRVLPAVQGIQGNELGRFGIESTFGFHDNELSWYRSLRTAPSAAGLLATDGTTYPFLQLLNVKYILHDRPEFPNPLPVEGYLPRFRLVGGAEIVDDVNRIADRIADPEFDPTQTVLLESRPPDVPMPDGGEFEGTVRSYTYDGNEIRVELDASRDGFLVHAENWFPYWRAYREGEEVPILRAYGALRAIPVGPGAQTIVLRYVDPPYFWGKVLCAGTLLLLALYFAGSRLTTRRRAS